LVIFGPENPEFTLSTITPFAVIRQKSAYQVKYPRISWSYLDLLYRFGRRIGGDDYPNVRLAVAQGTLPCNQLNFEDGRRHCQERPLLLALAFDNRLADLYICFQKFKWQCFGYIVYKFGELASNILGVYAVKTRTFVAIRPQFDDDLHSSRCRSTKNWKITILISAQ